MVKHKKEQRGIWFCDDKGLCSHCKKRLVKSQRHLWWFQELSGRKILSLTDAFCCSFCLRIHVMSGQNKKIIGGQRCILQVQKQDRPVPDLSNNTRLSKMNNNGKVNSNRHREINESQPSVPQTVPVTQSNTNIAPSNTIGTPVRKSGPISGKRTSISRKERNLLVNSQIVIEDYTWLHKFLQRHEHAGEGDIQSLPQQRKVFIRDMLGEILQKCPQEWAGDSEHPTHDLGDDRDDWTTCGLCGQRNRYVFFIVNRLNRKRLNVGSECVKEFDFDFESIGKTLSQLRRDMVRVQRRTHLNGLFPGIASVIDSWSRFLDRYPVVIPVRLEKPYLDCGREVKVVHDDYVSGKLGHEAIEDLRSLLSLRDSLLSQIDKYVAASNMNSPWTPTQEVARWLIGQSDWQTLQWLKEDGLITHRSACRIMHPTLMRHVAQEMHLVMMRHSVNVDSHDENGYVFTIDREKSIRLHIKHRVLMMEYGDWLFDGGQSRIEVLSLVNMSTVYGSSSLERIMDRLDSLLSSFDHSLVEYITEFDELYFMHNGTKTYSVLPFRTSVDRFKPLVFGLNGENIQKLVTEIRECKTKLSNEEYLDRKALREAFGKRG